MRRPPSQGRSHARSRPRAPLIAATTILVACGSVDGVRSEPGTPPRALVYERNPVVAKVGVVLAPDAPTWEGGGPSTWSVTPALPAGLSLDPGTGVVAGTPVVASPLATYTVTAANAFGSANADLVVTVEPGLAPPAHLRYAGDPAVLALGVPIVPIAPSSDGGPVAAYSVSPPLPAGLSLDPLSGVLSGAPAALAAEASYTFTAANAAGTSTFTLRLVVLAPGALWLSPSSVTCVTRSTIAFRAAVAGVPGAALTWSATGGTIDAGGYLEASRTPGTFTATVARTEDPAVVATAEVKVVARTNGNVEVGLLEPAGSEVAGDVLRVSARIVSRYTLERVEADLDGVAIPMDFDEEAHWSGILDLTGWRDGPHVLRVAGIDLHSDETEVFREITLVHPSPFRAGF